MKERASYTPAVAGAGAGQARPQAGLAEVIADQTLRALYGRLRTIVGELHADVEVVESDVELRAEVGGRLLCRVVPYRELLHLQIGESPMWETRIRDPREFSAAVDRLLRAFLRLVTGPRRPRSRWPIGR